MRKENQIAYEWLLNRLYRKYQIPKAQTKNVLCAISDLEWDWRDSKYDLDGINLFDILIELGVSRDPRKKKR